MKVISTVVVFVVVMYLVILLLAIIDIGDGIRIIAEELKKKPDGQG